MLNRRGFLGLTAKALFGLPAVLLVPELARRPFLLQDMRAAVKELRANAIRPVKGDYLFPTHQFVSEKIIEALVDDVDAKLSSSLALSVYR